MPPAAVFPIGFVSMTTGLTTHVIRAWERRYKAVQPGRSAGGRRLYSQEDIDRLQLLHRAVEKGHSISQIAALDDESLAGLTGPSPGPPLSMGGQSTDAAPEIGLNEIIADCMSAIVRLDGEGLHRTFRQAALTFSRQRVVDGVIVPLMEDVGSRWALGKIRIVHEHLASGAVQRYLWGLQSTPPSSPQAGKPSIMIATPAGQHCFLGAMAVAVTARDHGWKPVFLGPDLPVEELAAAGRALNPQLIALSITCHLDDRFMEGEMLRLAELLDDRFPIIVGGAASQAYRTGVERIGGALCPTTGDLIRRLH